MRRCAPPPESPERNNARCRWRSLTMRLASPIETPVAAAVASPREAAIRRRAVRMETAVGRRGSKQVGRAWARPTLWRAVSIRCEPPARQPIMDARSRWCVSEVRRTAALLVAVACAGCMVGPNYLRPPTPEGSAWHEPLQAGLSSSAVDREQLATWWTAFDDPLLSELVARAIAGNLDLQAARQRVREAQAQRAVAEAGLYPNLRAKLTLSPAKPSH